MVVRYSRVDWSIVELLDLSTIALLVIDVLDLIEPLMTCLWRLYGRVQVLQNVNDDTEVMGRDTDLGLLWSRCFQPRLVGQGSPSALPITSKELVMLYVSAYEAMIDMKRITSTASPSHSLSIKGTAKHRSWNRGGWI